MGLTIGTGEINLLQSLQLLYRNLWNQQSAVAHLGIGIDATKLAGAQNIAGIRERSRDADRAGLRVYLTINESNTAFWGKALPFESVRVSGSAAVFLSRSPPRSCARCVSVRYSESLIEKYALIGFSWDTEVNTDWVFTRLPT